LSLFIRIYALWLVIFGAIITAFISFILPSMLYFRLGVSEDYQAIPVRFSIGFRESGASGISILPNQLKMYTIQGVGLILTIGALGLSSLAIMSERY
jgi:hypothetical protein